MFFGFLFFTLMHAQDVSNIFPLSVLNSSRFVEILLQGERVPSPPPFLKINFKQEAVVQGTRSSVLSVPVVSQSEDVSQIIGK